MKQLSLPGVFEGGLLAVLLLIVLHAPLTIMFGVALPEMATTIKAWKEIILTLLSMLAVILVTRRGLWRQILHDRLFQLGVGFIGLHLLLVLLMGGDIRSVVAGLMIDLRFVVALLLLYVLVVLRPEALRRVLITAGLGAGVIVGFGVLQITVLPDDVLRPLGYSTETITPFTTIDKNPDYVRINSTLRGPNPLGAIAVLYAALLLAYMIRRRSDGLSLRRWAFIGASLAASVAVLFASYSRSAYLALAIALGLACIVGLGRVTKWAIVATCCIGLVGVTGLALVSTTDWYSNVVLHEDPESTVIAKSNDGHIESLADGANRMITQPLGAGIGSTGSASLYDADTSNDVIIENYYFYVAHESGWLGLALFIGLFGYVLSQLWKRRASWPALGLFCGGIGLALIGVLLPVWADETVALIWWGLAGAVIASTSGIIGGRHATRTRKQTTTGTA